ncbi:MAG: polysaccharide biosynthesis protein [Clostridiales bacterium]|nr:polysaccharide biosynthesis protein [Clostridiales bacterium]
MGRKNKKTGGSFIKQAVILAAASMIVRLLGFAYRVPLTNMIGDEGNGIYAAGYYIYTFFLILSSSGLPAAISKMISEKAAVGEYKNANKIFRVSLFVAGTLGLIGTAVMFFGAEWLAELIGSPRSVYTLVSLAPTIFICAIMSVYRGWFQGLNTTVPTAVSQVVEQIFNAFFSIFLAWLLIGYGIEWGAAGGTMGTGIGAFAGLIAIVIFSLVAKKYYKEMFSEDKGGYAVEEARKIAARLFKTTVPIITGTAIFSMTNIIDMKMVMSRLAASGAFTSQQADILYGQLTGKYVTLTTLPVSISTALATAVLPNIAASVVMRDKKAVKAKVNTSLRLTMTISIPAAIGMGALANQILNLLFPSYPEGGELLAIGAISIIFLALYQIETGILQGMGHVYRPALNALIGAAIKIPLNYVLIVIPEINVKGAVISTIGCYVAASLLNMYALKKAADIKYDFVSIIIKPLIASLVMGVGCLSLYKLMYKALPSNSICTILAILAAIVIFVVVLALLKGFKREDLILLPMGGKMISILEKFRLID